MVGEMPRLAFAWCPSGNKWGGGGGGGIVAGLDATSAGVSQIRKGRNCRHRYQRAPRSLQNDDTRIDTGVFLSVQVPEHEPAIFRHQGRGLHERLDLAGYGHINYFLEQV